MPLQLSKTLLARSLTLALSGALAHNAVGAALEEIVVTAQKNEEMAQTIPISLVAMDAGNLEKQGVTNLGELPHSVPNLQITPAPSNAASLRVYIRGVGNFDDQLTQDPSVAVYTDGVYVGRSQGLASEVADIERIEVLRGPQGTLYGRNATGGAINFITKAPEIGAWGFSQSFTVGSYDEFRSRTMINMPLTDTVALRLSYAHAEKDGFVKNEGTGADTFGSKDRQAIRADLRWQPNEQWDVRYSYDQSDIEDTAMYFVPGSMHGNESRPSKSRTNVNNFQPSDIQVRGHQLTANWEVSDDLAIKSITSYRTLDNYDYQDYLGFFVVEDDLHQKQWSQELQAVGSAFGDQLQYIAGLYYFEESGDGVIKSGAELRDIDIKNSAAAVFGQATYTPAALNQLHVTVGLRESKDKRKASLLITPTPADGISSGKGDKDFSNFSPSLTVAYDVSEEINAYAKVSRGYKSGGFNVRPSSAARFSEGFGPEKLTSYEIGAKTQWWDNRIRLNTAVFRAKYEDIQINTQSDPNNAAIADILNAGKATIDGVEVEMTAALTDQLTFGLNYGYLDAHYDKIINAAGADVTRDFIFVNAPHNSYIANIDYDIASTPIGDLRANVNYSWQDDQFTTTSTKQGKWSADSYGLLNARLTLADIPGLPAGKLRVSVWGKNLEDKEYSVIHAPLFGGYRVFGDPRSVGVDLVYEY